jgi:hypothetical protein
LVLKGDKLLAKVTVTVRRKGRSVVGGVVPTLLKDVEETLLIVRFAHVRPRIRELKRVTEKDLLETLHRESLINLRM